MKQSKAKPWLFSAPFFVAVALILLLPICYTLYLSVTNMNIYHWYEYDFIGTENYKRALLTFTSGFLPALLRTLVWTALNMALQLIIGFFIALGLNVKGLKLRGVYKTLLIFPWAMPAYISILIWRMGMFNPEFGFVNQILKALGQQTVNFLSTNVMAFCSCLVVNLWLALPYMFTMMDGALQSIDQSLYESAYLDGAGFWVLHTRLTVPMIKPILLPAFIMTTFTTFKQFDIIYLMTMQTGSRTGADINTIITYVYEKAFVTSNYGYSSAASVLVFVIIALLYTTWLRCSKSTGEE